MARQLLFRPVFGAIATIALEPSQVFLVTVPLLRFALEERVRLAQHQGVRPPDPSGVVSHGKLGSVDPAMDVGPPVLGERPLERRLSRLPEEGAQVIAQLAATPLGELDRPVIALPRRAGETILQSR